MTSLLFAYLPIVLLVYLMAKRRAMPSYRALPLTAAISYVVVLTVAAAFL